MDAAASGGVFPPDENAAAYGEVVWSWRRDRGVDPPRPCGDGNGDNKRRSPGRARISRKTIARGKPGCPGCTCGLTRVLFCSTLRTRDFCNGPCSVNPFLRCPLAGHLLLSGIGAGPSPSGVHEEQVGQSAESVITSLDASTTRVTAWPGPSSRRRDFAREGPGVVARPKTVCPPCS